MTASIGIVVDVGSATIPDILTQIDGLAVPVLIFDRADTHLNALRESLQNSVRCVELDSADPTRSLARGQLHELDAITTFAEDKLMLTAHVARELGLQFHSPQVAATLTDKAVQREALNNAGLTVRHAVAGDAAAVEHTVRAFGVDCIVKPLHGAGSRNTFRVSAASPHHSYELPEGTFPAVVEECLQHGPHPTVPALADYLSVETTFHRGRPHHFAATDKLPLAAPFRETGSLYPSVLPEATLRRAYRVTEDALRAVDVTCGTSHTELKLTSDGIAVIEVNGRLGGSIGRLASLATGVSAVRLALAAAMGSPPAEPSPATRLAGQWFVAPPVHASALATSVPVRQLKRLDGVAAVEVHARAGDPVDYRTGTLARVATIWYATATIPHFLSVHAAAQQLIEEHIRWT
jgi:biotin carboxylase